MKNNHYDSRSSCVDLDRICWVHVLSVPKSGPGLPDFEESGREFQDPVVGSNRDEFDKDILYFPREWSPDPNVHSNFYDEDKQDTIEVRPCGAIAQWLRSNPEFDCLTVAVNEIRAILNSRQAKLVRDRFGLYPPLAMCATSPPGSD